MKHTILLIIFLSIGKNSVSQFNLENSIWITDDHITFDFKQKEIKISDHNFIKNYEIKDDTLHFIHDYSSYLNVTVDGKKLDRKDFELPDSYFLISQNHKDSIQLIALNPSAFHILSSMKRNFGYNLTDKDIIDWEVNKKKPDYISGILHKKLNLINLNSITKERKIKKLKISTLTHGWHQNFIFDLEIIDSTYYAKKTDQFNTKDKKTIHTFYSGKIGQDEFILLEKLFGQSNFPDNQKVNYGNSFASHDVKFILEIEHTKGKSIIEGNMESLPDYAKPFIKTILAIPKEADKTTEINNKFN